jgi:FtsZ-interacting cell division protein ZipA
MIKGDADGFWKALDHELKHGRASKPNPSANKMSFAESERRLREETGIDDRTQAEKQASAEAERFEAAVAAGVQKALQSQKAPVKQAPTISQRVAQTPLASSITPKEIERLCQAVANIQAYYGNFVPQPVPTNQAQTMTAGHAAQQQPRQVRQSVVHSAGHAQVLTASEAQARLRGLGLKF